MRWTWAANIAISLLVNKVFKGDPARAIEKIEGGEFQQFHAIAKAVRKQLAGHFDSDEEFEKLETLVEWVIRQFPKLYRGEPVDPPQGFEEESDSDTTTSSNGETSDSQESSDSGTTTKKRRKKKTGVRRSKTPADYLKKEHCKAMFRLLYPDHNLFGQKYDIEHRRAVLEEVQQQRKDKTLSTRFDADLLKTFKKEYPKVYRGLNRLRGVLRMKGIDAMMLEAFLDYFAGWARTVKAELNALPPKEEEVPDPKPWWKFW